jgi:tRNA pseudouridine synthase 10
MLNPKCLDVDLAALEAEINRRNREVSGLHWTEKTRVRSIKEDPHAKEYAARVRVEGTVAPELLESLKGKRYDVVQNTPSRVAHRRAEKARERWIELVDVAPIEGSSDLLVRIRTQHGTYVKEVVNGESGSTKPSLTELFGHPCTCVELDVLAILDVDGKAEPPRPARVAFGENV